MSKRISRATKLARGQGSGEGATYKPYVMTNEFNSLGTTSVIKDWKTGRGVHCLSQAEALWYYILRWDDNNIDIREQYPLDRNITSKIADKYGFKHPGNSDHIMTTDFLVTKKNIKLHAYSVKPDRNPSKRTLEILCIEKLYWKHNNIEFDMLFKEDVNTILASNIRLVTEYYDERRVFDRYSNIRHNIATKKISCDMEFKILTNDDLDKIWGEYCDE